MIRNVDPIVIYEYVRTRGPWIQALRNIQTAPDIQEYL